jgi:hypothetical protein
MPELQPPTGLRAWGLSLWDRVTEENTFDAAGYFILAEACRTADIIEQLSGALRSRTTHWMSVADEVVAVVQQAGVEVADINPIIGEVRQQRLAMRQLLAQLKLGNIASGTAEDDDPIAKMMAEMNSLD